MHPFFIYIIKANALLLLFWLVYTLFLKNETFYKALRAYFLLSIACALVAPLVTFTKTVIIAQSVVDEVPYLDEDFLNEMPAVAQQPTFWENIDWQTWLLYLLVAVSGAMVLQMVYKVFQLIRNIQKMPPHQNSNIRLADTEHTVYSFYRWIIVPRNIFSRADFQMILDHENVHLNQKHTFDLLIIELVSAVFWFNPLIKRLQKDININLEYIVDEEMIGQHERVAYQKSLIGIQSTQQLALTSAFNTSDLKKRILHINAKKSTKMKRLKLLLTAPTLAAFFAMFQVETIAQVQTEEVEVEEIYTDIELLNSYSDENYEDFQKTLNEKYNLGITFSNLNRNKEGLLTEIKIDWGNNNQLYKKADTPFEPFRIHIYKEGAVYKAKFLSGSINHNSVLGNEYVEVEEINTDTIPNHKVTVGQYTASEATDEDLANAKTISVGSYNDAADYKIVRGGSYKDSIHYKAVWAEYAEEDAKEVSLKGMTSLNINQLYIIDGTESTLEDLRKIKPGDIEKIDVIKDKEKLKKHGKKAKNGVLIITTKANKDVAVQQHVEDLKARERAVQQRKETLNERKEVLLDRKKEIEKAKKERTAALKKAKTKMEKAKQQRIAAIEKRKAAIEKSTQERARLLQERSVQ